ncbi:MAG: tetratricopeptide repeat protein [Sphingomicrobium sp.]
MTLGLALALALAQADAAPLPLVPSIANPSLSEAGHAISAGRLDQAREMLAAAVAAGAKGDPVDRLLADLAYARGEDEQALALYTALLAAHPGEALLLERGGIAALRLGRAELATALLDRATRAPGAGWRAWNARGVAAERYGRWDEADAAYDRAKLLGPDRAEIANNRGWSMMLRGRWSEALEAFTRAAGLNPKLPRLANNLELAAAALSAALPRRIASENDEQFAARLNDAGVVAAASGDTKRAEAAFAQAIGLRSRWFGLAAGNLAALAAPE